MERKIIKVSYGEVSEVLWGGSESLELVSKTISDQNRWSTFFDVILKNKDDGKYYYFYLQRGSTECQEGPDDDELVELKEVIPVEKTVTVYEWPNG